MSEAEGEGRIGRRTLRCSCHQRCALWVPPLSVDCQGTFGGGVSAPMFTLSNWVFSRGSETLSQSRIILHHIPSRVELT